jgi:type IV pilus assembly protein PilY1
MLLRSWKSRLGLVLGLWAFGVAWADMAQSPLLSRTVNVKPNVALILDTSSSMNYTCVYAPAVNAGILNPSSIEQSLLMNVPNPVRLKAGMVDPCWDTTDYLDSNSVLYALQGNRIQMNPFTNHLYYNPRKTYARGYVAGVQQAAPSSSNDATLFWPKSMSAFLTYSSLTQFATPANYNKVVFNSAGFTLNGFGIGYNPFGNHGGTRTDCAGDPCTLAEELVNYAVWNAHHSTRLLAAKTGLTGAFLRQSNNFRITYGTIYDTSSTLPVFKDFDSTPANNPIYPWIDGLTPKSGTPLRTVLNMLGRRFLSKENSGPWGSNPSNPPSGEKSTDHLYCRRSYAILTTDGWWNDADPAPSLGEIDSLKNPTITYDADSTKNYTYIPGDTSDLRSIGKSDNITGAGGTSDTLADVSMKYWVTDLRPDLPNKVGNGNPSDPPFWQNLTTYTVGFGVPGTMSDAQVALAKRGQLNWTSPVANTPSTVDDLRHAAWNGGGEYLNVTDATGFSRDLGNLIGNIVSQQFSQSGVAASAVSLTAGTKKFIPTYSAGTWWGNVEMVYLDSTGATTGSAWKVISTDKNGKPTATTNLGNPSARNIHVWVNNSKGAVPFTYGNLIDPTNSLQGSNSNLQFSGNLSADQVNYLRGDQSKEGVSLGYRVREAVLGDIVNSAPVFIKNNTDPIYQNLPTSTPGYASYSAYMATKAARAEGVLVVGANDGMLHVFAEGAYTSTGGREVFAYVPRSVLGKMEGLTQQSYAHQYLVDGPLNETDAYITVPDPANGIVSTGWTNIVVGSTGAGAKSVFAVNVTTPLAMTGKSVLWEINADSAFPVTGSNTSTSFANLGYVLSAPQSGVTVSGDWVTIFGNGYASANGVATLYIVKTSTGELIKEITTDNNNQNGLGGVRLVLNANQQIMGAYAGDLLGQLWKFDLSSVAAAGWGLGNGGRALFKALGGPLQNIPLPITAAPGVVQRSDQSNYNPSYLLTVGTGKLFESTDTNAPNPTTLNQAVYGLWDRLGFGNNAIDTISETSLVSLSLVDVTQSVSTSTGKTLNNGGITNIYGVQFADSTITSLDWSTKRGWKLPLSNFSGMRVVYPVQMLNDVAKIDTVSPNANADTCIASNSSAISIYMDPLNANCNASGTFDINGDGTINSQDKAACAYSSLADGMDVALRVATPNGSDSGLRDIQNSSGHMVVNTRNSTNPCNNSTYASNHVLECKCPDPTYALANTTQCCASAIFRAAYPGNCTGSIKSRSWRQIFPR